MNKPVSELTYKIVAYSVIDNFVWDDCVDWAYEMMLLGYDTPNLVLLASITKPTDSFETQSYLKAALSELGLREIEGEEATIIYSSYYVRKIAKSENIKLNLYRLKQFYNELDHSSALGSFWALYWAWDDLDSGMDYQHYWDGATNDNVGKIAIEEAEKWLKEYEGQLELQL